MSLIRQLLDQFPSICPLCQLAARAGQLCAGCHAQWFRQRQARVLCRTCGLDLDGASASEVRCHPCQAEPVPLRAMVCALDYDGGGRALIEMYKTQKQLALAGLLGALMAKAVQAELRHGCPSAWVPIPASRERLKRNGFSPAQQLARAVATRTGIAWRLDWLSQPAERAPQKLLTRRERQLAVQGQFIASAAVQGQCVGLIDDVVTTGSTVFAAAHALKAAGADAVVVLAAARAPRRRSDLAQSRACFM
jgi:ComF family protein